MSLTATPALTTRTRTAYGVGEGGWNLLLIPVSLFLLFYLTTLGNLSPATAGAIAAAGLMISAVSDVAIGAWSDRARWRHGRRRPLILGGLAPLTITFILLFTPPPTTSFAVPYYATVAVLFYVSLTVVHVPYAAPAAEMTSDYDERTSVQSYRAAAGQIGLLLGAALPPLLVGWFGGASGGWMAAAAVLATAAAVLYVISWNGTRGLELGGVHATALPLRRVLGDMRRNRTFMRTMLALLLGYLAIDLGATVLVFSMSAVLNLTEEQQAVAFLVAFGAGVPLVPALAWLGRRVGKRSAFAAFALLGFVGSLAVITVRPGQDLLFLALLTLAGIVVTAMYLYMWSMIADVVEVDELRTGHRHEGLYFGASVFFSKLATGLSTLLVGLVLAAVDYTEGADSQSQATVDGIRALQAYGPAALYLIAAATVLLVPMTRARHSSLVAALERRRQGVPGDEGEITRWRL